MGCAAWPGKRHRTLIQSVLQFAAVPLFFGWAREALAESMPSDAPQTLQTILSSSKFQPREYPTSFATELKLRAGRYIMEKWHEWSSWVQDRAQNTELNPTFVSAVKWVIDWLYWFLSGAVSVFDALLWPIFILAVLGVGFIVFRNLRFKKLPSGATGLRAIIKPADVALDPFQLAKDENWIQLLSEIRRRLRSDFSTRYLVSPSATDREVVKAVPNLESRKPLFDEVASLFEGTAYAAQPVDVKRVQNAFDSYKGQQ